MAIDYSIHTALPQTQGGGRTRYAPIIPHVGGEKGLAYGAASAAITGPCEICITPEDKVRIDIRAAASEAALNPAVSPLVLGEGSNWFHIPTGSWKLKAVAA